MDHGCDFCGMDDCTVDYILGGNLSAVCGQNIAVFLPTDGENFFIDHGTGIVIGETCIIGENVKLYQGVTLGAKSFPTDDNDEIIKGIERHPILEDNVVVYAGATILGRITIGKNAVIGGNTWVTQPVSEGTVLIKK